jgi:hypothetical protein
MKRYRIEASIRGESATADDVQDLVIEQLRAERFLVDNVVVYEVQL